MKFLWTIAVVLLGIAVWFAWLLFTPVSPVAQGITPIATSTAQDTNAPLHERVVLSSPVANATVGQSFTVAGEAPGNWYFEASFPIQVRDKDGNVIARTHGQALGDWMTTDQVSFLATTTLDAAYVGPATLVLLRDNPSGLPENDDSFEVPIVVR